MENMENVVMNGDVQMEAPAEVAGTSLVGKIVGGLIIGGVVVGVGTLARKAYKAAKKAIQTRKAKKATDVVVEDYEEVPCEEEA